MDLYGFLQDVRSAFYQEFDYTDDTYYWVRSITDENTLIAEDGKTGRYYLVSFSYEESNDQQQPVYLFTFQQKSEWQEVQYTFVAIEGRQELCTETERRAKIAEYKKRNANRVATTGEGPQVRSFSRQDFNYNEETRQFSGYGVVFDSDSHPLTIRNQGRAITVIEQISRASLSDVNTDDVVAAFNHNFDKIFGRTTAGTLTLEIDQKGVLYRFDVPNTTAGNDLLVSVERGDISGSSFTFLMDSSAGYSIEERADGNLLAIPNKITRIMELGPVVFPAYPETTAENRSQLVDAVVNHLKRAETPPLNPDDKFISDERQKHLELKLRHNEEAALI